jgi:5-methyltetrahydropteroyltriglutamate--homocysteine methyltransferase
MGVGSYATPGWLFHFREGMRQGAAGPADIEEAFEDAARIAVADQIEAGIDVICDGELRRMRFVFEMFDRLSGLERQALSKLRRRRPGSIVARSCCWSTATSEP